MANSVAILPSASNIVLYIDAQRGNSRANQTKSFLFWGNLNCLLQSWSRWFEENKKKPKQQQIPWRLCWVGKKHDSKHHFNVSGKVWTEKQERALILHILQQGSLLTSSVMIVQQADRQRLRGVGRKTLSLHKCTDGPAAALSAMFLFSMWPSLGTGHSEPLCSICNSQAPSLYPQMWAVILF